LADLPPAVTAEDRWDRVLDDLEDRVVAAEAGDLAALAGWVPPEIAPRPMRPHQQRRATGVLARQHALLDRLRNEQRAVGASIRAIRRPRRAEATPPVYVDRTG
jgi:hypothetical protein